MSNTVLTKLLDLRNKAHADAQEISRKATEEQRSLNADEQEKFDRAFADMESFDKQLKAQERMANLEDYSEIRDNGVQFGVANPEPEVRSQEEVQRDYADAFEKHMIRGGWKSEMRGFEKDLPRELRDAQNITTPADGGYLVPEYWQDEIIKSLKYYGPMLEAGSIFRTTGGNPLNLPTHNATSEKGAIIGEDTGDSISKTAFGTLAFGAFMYTSKIIPITYELLQDSAYDVTGEVIETMASRIGRILNEHLTTGAGTTQPYGVVTRATNSNITTSALNAVAATDLVDLEHSVDPLYRKSPATAFMFHDSTLAAIKKLSYGTSDDRPLWLPSVRVGEPDTILGYKYWINNDMADLSTNANKAILFGDFSKYRIRQVMGMTIRRSDEYAWEKRVVAFNMIARYDANLVDTAAIKYLAADDGQ